ncbi:MAG: hypothetical protein KGN36_14635, partial [Acidobacteriota bacterium]|nr:hypothetical protein [Acidobacteriota bacterium]
MTKPLTKFVPTAALLLGLSAILLPVTARADSFKLSSYPGGNPAGSYTYGNPGTTIPAGPYQGQLTTGGSTHTLLVYCLDGDLTSYY